MSASGLPVSPPSAAGVTSASAARMRAASGSGTTSKSARRAVWPGTSSVQA